MSGVDVRSLGCVPMDTVGGTASTVAAANVAHLNAFLLDNWRGAKAGLYFPAAGWLVNGTVVVALSGTRLCGAGGEAVVTAEHTYTLPNFGGPVSRLVAENATLPATPHSPILRFEGYGPVMDGLHVQGRWAPFFTNEIIRYQTSPDLFYPISSLLLNDATAHALDARPLLGIEVEGSQGPNVHTGKIVWPTSLCVSVCRVGIACIPMPNNEHGDQLNLNRFAAPFCDVGIRLLNVQSVAHTINHYDQLNCDTAFRVEQGGNIQCNLLDMQGGSALGLHLHGFQGEAGGYFNFGVINVDESAPSSCRCIFVDPPANPDPPPVEGSVAADINVGFLQAPYGRTTEPLIELRNFYGSVNIFGGQGFYNGMIKTTGGNADYFPTVRVFNASFQNGHSPAPDRIFTSDSSGYLQYEQHGCTEGTGTGANEGQIFPAFRGLLSLTNNPPYVTGGFSYHPGAINSITSNYTATAFDESILLGSGGTVNIQLPAASTVRGKIYRFKNLDPSSPRTVNAAGSDNIDGASFITVPAAGGVVIIQSDGLGNWYAF